MKKIFDIIFLKFIVVGILNTIIGTSVMFISYNYLGFNYWISSALNYLIGSIFSFFLNKNFTFRSAGSSFNTILKFIINISVCYILAYGIAKPLIYLLLSDQSIAIQENIAMFLGMGLFIILNYLGQRFWTFKETGKN